VRTPFIFVIFLGSFMLFLIQPMLGRMILPRLRGVPAVWNLAMLLFQAMLLCFCLYARFGRTRASDAISESRRLL